MRVLVVDDADDDRRLLHYFLESRGFEVAEAQNGVDALDEMKVRLPDLVLSDGLMPEMDGFNLLRAMKSDPRLACVPFVFYSSVFKDAREAELAESLGASAFIIKGTDEEEFWAQLQAVLAADPPECDAVASELIREDAPYLRRYSSMVALRLEREVAELRKTQAELAEDIRMREQVEAALLESNAQLERMVFEVAEAMGRVVEARDPYTQGHQVRVAGVCKLMALEMGLSATDVTSVEMAALVHDIGKLAIPAEILTKPGRLTSVEFRLIQEHPQRGYEILIGVNFPWPVADIAVQHHERMDGSGYPAGLSHDEILPLARIMAVADVVEAMSSHRPYRAALGLDAAIAELRNEPHKYDPDAVNACVRLFEQGRLDL